MRIVTFIIDGEARLGVLVGDVVHAAAGLPDGVTSLRRLLAVKGLAGLAGLSASTEQTWPLSTVELAPPLPDPGKIICVGVNYRTHREETDHASIPHPTIFTRFADTQVAAEQPVLRPAATDQFDYEGELAVVIGEFAHAVSKEQAWTYVAGLSVYNDFTARDWQKHSTQWIPGKNFPGTGAFGPALVTLDEVGDIQSQTLITRVNGQIRQKAQISDMILDVPSLISYISTFTPLYPGDVLVTGTPGGVGKFMTPPVFLQSDDEVEVEITGVGILRNAITVPAEVA
jgi:2-keto-4-pentenoate hydratase/2-oxohepta-3-ene-1,7-dioic acid hydratase in catechol pathway